MKIKYLLPHFSFRKPKNLHLDGTLQFKILKQEKRLTF